jgi:hypothetical protein
MTRSRQWLAATLALALLLATAPPAPAPVAAQTAPAGGAWMDITPLPVWNQPGAAIPAAPAGGNLDPRCQATERQPETNEDRAVAAAGWRLYGESEAGWGTRLIWGLSGYDGMCRPMGFQVHVFLNERFVGTLAPQPMNSRSDGALQSTALTAPIPGAAGRIAATYSRFTAQDALCCPSSTTEVQFRIQLGPQGANAIAGRAINTPATPPAAATPQGPPAAAGASATNTYSPGFAGVSFTYDLSLSPYVKWEEAAAVPLPAEPEPGLGGAMPQRVQFSFVEGPDSPPSDCGTLRAALLCVFPVAGMRALDPSVAKTVDDLSALLASRPANPAEIPVFPVVPAHQVFRAQVRYLSFPGGAGVRFVTYFAQDASPVTNQSVFLTFQGLTSDGRNYVCLFWPVDTAALPNTVDEGLGGQSYDAWSAQYDAYLARTVQTLNGLSPDAFTPNLTLLDNLLQSIQISR